jgi:uncharacterized damage-inducible protein DinB
MSTSELIDNYVASARQLREGVAGLSLEQLKQRPIAGKWSTLEVVCHIADFEIVFADRIKRVIAEDKPNLPSGDDKVFAAHLRYHDRDADNEIALVDAIHRQVAAILRTLKPEDFQRTGIHSEAGTMTLESLVDCASSHITHHLKFVAEKRRAMGM